MLHLGDITKISGHEAPIIDCIIGGSPCQDLSVAGKRAGLDGERSGLFMEQLRIVKEMREHDRQNGRTDEHIRPRYMVWENVPGAFSSNKGEDFRVVLEEIAKIKDENAIIPMPKKRKWTTSGCIVGDGWSIAWRVLDAQFWGVPQRRRRIALVADFTGESAGEILFVRKSLSRDIEQSESQRENSSTNTSTGIRADDNKTTAYTLKIRSGCEGGGKGALVQVDKSATLSTLQDQTLFQPAVCYGINGEVAGTLDSSYYKSCGMRQGVEREVVFNNYIVRRLTPLECERLQGYPDGWTDIGEWTDSKGKIRKTSDAARYKALGNSIALPPWKWVLKRICACYERDATCGSLFDGIGGFPLIWEQLNGKGSCLWASEIEEFPIAVTKKRIGGDSNGGEKILLAKT